MLADHIEAIAANLQTVEPAIALETIISTVSASIRTQPPALRMRTLLEDEPDLLTSGSPRMPRALERITAALNKQGATTLQRPRCNNCNLVRTLPNSTGGALICSSCHQGSRGTTIECFGCDESKRRHSGIGNRSYCQQCWADKQAGAQTLLANNLMSRFPNVPERGVELAIAKSGARSADRDRTARLLMECEAFGDSWFLDPAPASRLFRSLYDGLRDAGATLDEPVCGHCKKPGPLGSRRDGLICCRKCYRAGHLAICDGCGQEAGIERRQPDGQGLCQRCTNKLSDESADCSLCGHHRLIAARTPEGPVCSTCRTNFHTSLCTICAKEAPCRFAGSEMAICLACRSAQKYDRCQVCGNERKCRFEGTTNAICEQCANRREPCLACGQTRLIRRRMEDGQAICWSCVDPIIETCTQCRKDRIVNGRVNRSPYCPACYPLHPASFRDCRRCGHHEHLRQSRLCDRCEAEDKIKLLFPQPLIDSDPRIGPLRTACLKADPGRVLSTFRYKTTVALLQRLLTKPGQLDHTVVDQAGPEAKTRAVRAFLVEYGLLPQRDEILARFEIWITRAADTIPALRERHAFVQFARWRHLRVLRQQDSHVRNVQADNRRNELRDVIHFLSWAGKHGESLASVTQSHVDRWLTEGPISRRLIHSFLTWARRNHYCTRLVVPSIPRSQLNVTGADETDRLRLLTETLEATSLDPRTRLAAALVLLYGIRASRIVQLQIKDFSIQGGNVLISLGSQPLALPGAVGDIASLALATRGATRMFGSVGDIKWLIPGTRSGYPLSPVSLGLRLKALGILPSHARAGALTSLSGQLPPVILARLTGLEISAAIRWSNAVSASNARYAGLITSPHNPNPEDAPMTGSIETLT